MTGAVYKLVHREHIFPHVHCMFVEHSSKIPLVALNESLFQVAWMAGATGLEVTVSAPQGQRAEADATATF